MANGVRKLKILYILEILSQKSDENHPASVDKIIAELEKRGIPAERKSLYSDIAALRDFGAEVVTVKSKTVGYYIKNKPFSPEEFEILWDAVSVFEFVSPQKCGEIKKKLETLAGEHEKKTLRKRIYTVNKSLRQTEVFRATLGIIHKSIAEKKQLFFRYTEEAFSRAKPKKETFTVSPYIVSCSGANISLIAGCPKMEGLNHFYIDRIEDAMLLPQNATDVREFVGDMEFDLMCYSRGLFDSYLPESVSVTLQCGKDALNTVIGTFGKQIIIERSEAEKTLYDVSFECEISERLISWLFLNNGAVTVLEPPELVEALKNTARDVYIRYS